MQDTVICVVGLGYIGLPTAAMFASRDKYVIGIDIDQNVVDKINLGEIHIVEPGLASIVGNAVSKGYLRAAVTPQSADVFFIAVPTPFLLDEAQIDIPQPDLRYIESAAKAIAKVLKKGDIVILESTSPVGTTEKLAGWLSQERADLTFPQTHNEESDIRIAYCPERVLPGQIMRELVENDRIVGGLTNRCSKAAIEVYKTFVRGECVVTNARTAEMAKLTENASRDVSIAFANELSIICDQLDINVWELITLCNRHPRVNILQPGPGVGGHCIAVDPWFIVSQSPIDAKLIKQARSINDQKPLWVIEKVKLAIANILLADPLKSSSDITIACYGLSFKPNIDDLRESPAVIIAKKIIAMHSSTALLVEPNIVKLPLDLKGGLLSNIDIALSKADIHLLLVDHSEFYNRRPSSGIVIDTRGIWSA
jgi:UDP-N-acetyl-D-mannosaminuronic acid dehydrogenase